MSTGHDITAQAPRSVWSERISVGAWVVLVCIWVSILRGVLVEDLAQRWAHVPGRAVSAVLWVVGVWRLTEPEPGTRRRWRPMRWASRTGALLWIVLMGLSAVLGFGWADSARDTLHSWAVGIFILSELGDVAFLLYLYDLSQFLKDRLLRILFGVGALLGFIGWFPSAILGAVGVLSGRLEEALSDMNRGLGIAGHEEPSGWGWTVEAALAGAGMVVLSWLIMHRLLRRLREVGRDTALAGEDNPVGQ